jgi:hypothetical protein
MEERALDNVFVERLWRSVKYEGIYLHDYATVWALEQGLGCYFPFYNNERPHQNLDYECLLMFTTGRPPVRLSPNFHFF